MPVVLVHSALSFYLDDDWFKQYDAIVTRLSRIQGKSKNKVMLELLKRHIDENRRFYDGKITDFEVERKLESKSEELEIICKECGAARHEVDEYGLLIHKPECSDFEHYKKAREIYIIVKAEQRRQQEAEASKPQIRRTPTWPSF